MSLRMCVYASGFVGAGVEHADKYWAQFKAHFSAAHHKHKHIQCESTATCGYHSVNAAVGQTEEQMAEATIGALANITTATAEDRGVVATLTEANARLANQLEDNSNELRELKALIKKERTENETNAFSTHHQKILLDSRLQGHQYSHQCDL
jgi:hypothetical protein